MVRLLARPRPQPWRRRVGIGGRTLTLSSVTRAAIAGTAQPRLPGAQAPALRPGGLPGGGGRCEGGGVQGCRRPRRGGGARPSARGWGPQGRSYAVIITAAVPAAGPASGKERGGPPSALTVSEAGSPVLSDMAAALRARRPGSGAPRGSRRPATSRPVRAPAATPLPWQPRGPRMWRPARRADCARARTPPLHPHGRADRQRSRRCGRGCGPRAGPFARRPRPPPRTPVSGSLDTSSVAEFAPSEGPPAPLSPAPQ